MYLYPKNFMSIPQLIQKLENSGVIIDSKEEAECALTTIGYYRLKGYCFHLIDPQTKRYIPGTKFSNILKLYKFDFELSNLVFNYISEIEVALRARLVNAFYSTHNALILNDPSIFEDKEKYWKNQGTIAAEIARSDDVFIKHNFIHHDGAIPLWAAVEIMSFGTLSKIIKNLNPAISDAFSTLVQDYKFLSFSGRAVTPSKTMFTSWIHAVSIMRNICAHNGRIYNRSISTRPQLLATDTVLPQPRYNGLYQIMLAMKYLRPNDSSWKIFICNFNALLTKYAGIYDISRLNFPSDWTFHFQI